MAAITAAALLLVACDPGEREARPFVGRWQSEGYGIMLDIHGGTVDVYEHSAIHCLRVASGATRGISEAISIEGGQLVLRDEGRVVTFTPLETLPSRCADPVASDPMTVFSVAVETVREHALPEPGPEWATLAAEIGATLHADSTSADLHAAMVEVLHALDDPEFRIAAAEPGLPAAWSSEDGSMGRALFSHSDATVMAGGHVIGRDLEGGFAYFGVSLLAAPDEDDQRALAAALDSVLDGADGVVIDLRGASGGLEEAALLVATRFVPTERAVARRLIRAGDRLVEAGELRVTPRLTGTFAGAVVVLVGPSTTGAGELLAWILADLPGITVVGEPTAGSARDPLVRALPNGWSLGVPNADVVGLDSGSRVGVPLVPDIAAPTTLDDLAANRDPGLTAALQVLGGG